jgi:hypothetical protein
MRARHLWLVGGVLVLIAAAGLLGLPAVLQSGQVAAAPDRPAPAAPDIFASPVQAGCYIAAPFDCRMHVEPFTINIASGKKLSFFQLVTIQQGTGIQKVIYDWRPDQSNPVPDLGNTYTPSLVAQDFAATCGKTYEISLQGKDTGDASAFNLGLTGFFTCPASAP